MSDPPGPAPLARWQVGEVVPPTAPDAAAARAARLEARLVVYAQYAAVVAEQATAIAYGDRGHADALGPAREAAAEHFEELRHDAGAGYERDAFADALGDALAELRHQDAVDLALRHRLLALRDAVARGAAVAPTAKTAADPVTARHAPADADCGSGGVPGALESGWTAARLALPVHRPAPVAVHLTTPTPAPADAASGRIDIRF